MLVNTTVTFKRENKIKSPTFKIKKKNTQI